MPELKVIIGNYKKDMWFQDPDMPQEEVDFINDALREAAKLDPRWQKLIWYKSNSHSRLSRRR